MRSVGVRKTGKEGLQETRSSRGKLEKTGGTEASWSKTKNPLMSCCCVVHESRARRVSKGVLIPNYVLLCIWKFVKGSHCGLCF